MSDLTHPAPMTAQCECEHHTHFSGHRGAHAYGHECDPETVTAVSTDYGTLRVCVDCARTHLAEYLEPTPAPGPDPEDEAWDLVDCYRHDLEGAVCQLRGKCPELSWREAERMLNDAARRRDDADASLDADAASERRQLYGGAF